LIRWAFRRFALQLDSFQPSGINHVRPRVAVLVPNKKAIYQGKREMWGIVYNATP
jgi:hypothetical protein